MFVPADPRTAGHLAVAIRVHRETMRRAGVHVPADLAQLEETCTIWASKGQQGSFLADVADVVDGAGMKKLLSIPSAADALDVSESTVKRLLRDGALPSVKVAGARRIHVEHLDAYLAGLDQRATA